MTLSNPSQSNRVNTLVKDMTSFVIHDFSEQSLDNINDQLLVEIPIRVDLYKNGKGKEKKTIHLRFGERS